MRVNGWILVSVVALCMFADQKAPHAKNKDLIPILKGLLAKYERCIIEKYETAKTEKYEHRDKSTCSNGKDCDMASRKAAWMKLNALAAEGDPTGFDALLKSAVIKDCFECSKHKKWHTKHTHCTMDCGGNDEFKHGFGTGGCFEGCKAGVDINAFFNDLDKEFKKHAALFKGNFDGQGATHVANLEKNEGGGDTVDKNHTQATPTDAESCHSGADGYFVPDDKDLLDWTPTEGPSWHEALTGYDPGGSPASNAFKPGDINSAIGANEGRLRADLRAVAKKADPRHALCKSVVAFGNGKNTDGTALADLSVTGRKTFTAFKAKQPTAAEVMTCAKKQLAGKSDVDLTAWTDKALKRAYRVAQVLRAGGWPEACPERNALGYIAVSGEDDQPHRPVNAPSAEFQQHDVQVKVGGVVVNSRFMIAQTKGGGRSLSCADQGMKLPEEPAPVLEADAEVFLFIHGMDSRLEEALNIMRALQKLGDKKANNKNYVMIAFDLPSSGYADNIDYNKISPITTIGKPGFGLGFAPNKYDSRQLDFIETYIVRFVSTLEDKKIVPGVSKRIRAVIGGSLGGNMSMRLGRPRADAPWIEAVVPWSPAGLWGSKADKDIEHVALRLPWTFAGGDAKWRKEEVWSRGSFFYGGFDFQSKIFGIINVTKPQAQEWYRDGWKCKQEHLRLSRVSRYETYNENFRRWRWRLATEQMMYSHTIKKNGAPLYSGNTKRTLLICGIDDTGGGLCEATRGVARDMKYTPGHGLFLNQTGHSIQDERPNFLARHLADFIVPSVPTMTWEQDYTRSGGGVRVSVTSAEACRDACKNSPTCKAFWFIPRGATSAGCTLQDKPGTKTFNIDAVAGAKK